MNKEIYAYQCTGTVNGITTNGIQFCILAVRKRQFTQNLSEAMKTGDFIELWMPMDRRLGIQWQG